MTYEELRDIIENSSQTDWLRDDVRGVWTYEKDLMLRFEEERGEERKERLFREPWVEKFPDKTAFRVTYVIYYGSSFVQEVTVVSVDGHRTVIPLPNSQNNLVITPWQYQFGKILDQNPTSTYSLDAQMKHAGIRVE